MQHCQLNLFNMLQFQHLNCLNKKDTLMTSMIILFFLRALIFQVVVGVEGNRNVPLLSPPPKKFASYHSREFLKLKI